MNLIIVFDKNAYFFPFVQSEENHVVEVLRSNRRLWKIVRRMPFVFSLAFNKIIKKKALTANKIIIFDSAYTSSLGKYLKKYKSKNKLYIWNPISIQNNKKIINRIEKAKKYTKVYSFDKNDCRNFKLEFSPMIYTRRIENKGISNEINVFFLGAGKKRIDTLDEITSNLLKKINNCKYIIIGNRGECKNDNIIFSEKRYTYEEYLNLLKKSKVLLDIPQEGQIGNTIRVTESMFYRKKLITTNKDIVNYDFYNPKNIFVIGLSTNIPIEEFINSEYVDIEERLLDEYDFDKWVDIL
ncbi:hypothetical protein [uncultured Ruminococcus sp.]|uniref:hypothetical protein n=1 Tax=uncultured Ruminococcus sp. TaxID=165186 RepID=UPI0025F95EDF|nr:hypothetical protein [uncultured Ruminococcus sp.]